MERARKKTQNAVEVAPVVDAAATEPSKTKVTRRKPAAAKKVADPKVVEAAEPSAVEATPPETPSTAVKTARRGRPAKTTAPIAGPKASTRTPRTTASTTKKPATVKAGVTEAKTSRTSSTKTKAPAPKPTRATRPKATVKAAASKPAVSKGTVSKGIEPLEAGAEIKLGFLADFVGFHLRLAQDASYRAFARHRDKDLIKPGRLPALAIIHLNPGISQSALGRAIARDKSTVSPLIKDLQKNGFISRKASTQDRRSVTLALTKKGERTLERLQARAQDHESEIDKIIGASKGRLLSMLDKITTGMAP